MSVNLTVPSPNGTHLNYTGMFLIEMWADNTKKQTMEEAVETIRQARLFVEDKMEQAGIKVPA